MGASLSASAQSSYLSPEPLLQAPEYVSAMAGSGSSVPTYAYASTRERTLQRSSEAVAMRLTLLGVMIWLLGCDPSYAVSGHVSNAVAGVEVALACGGRGMRSIRTKARACCSVSQ